MSEILDELYTTIRSRRTTPPPNSYTALLFQGGMKEIAKKVGEEAIEVIIAGQGEDEARVVSESADLVYHLLVLLAARGIEWRAVEAELGRRRGSPILR